LTINELASQLKVSKWWLYRLASEGKIPAMRLGRAIRFDEGKIERWLDEKSNSPIQEKRARCKSNQGYQKNLVK